MKRIALLSLCLLMIASLAFAQGGRLGLFSDTGATNCNYADVSVGLSQLYVIHLTDGIDNAAAGISFKIEIGAGANMAQAGVTGAFPLNIGEPYTGVSAVYNVCAALPALVYTLGFFNTGTSLPCSFVSIVAHPIPGAVISLACSSIEYPVTGGQAIVNSDGSCDCNIPTEQETWGKIKSLYSAN